VDLETTCTNTHAEQFQNEIIEIGLSIVDVKNYRVERNLSIMVKPQRSQVTEFCTQLTGIKPEDVADGLTLPEAAEVLLKEYDTLSYVWSSWGDFDRYMMNRECTHYKCRIPFNRQHLNLKALYGLNNFTGNLMGLGSAVKHSGMKFLGQQHRGVDDARTAAQIFINLQLGQRNVRKED
jgi:inhibitor of KinA sporulation pathway (predicted exonuclease)